jgi:large subunit ribosomal protein L15
MAVAEAEAEAGTEPERFRLNNLAPQPGSRRRKTRKGRGIAAGQGASCGFGMRGQKSRSGSGVRPGFEGGQMPLYRRLPKLRGIAGGMPKGRTTHVAVNLEDIVARGLAVNGGEVSRESLIANGLIKPSGKERNLPLKVLGDGDITEKFTIQAGAFSKTAKEKLEAAGCTVVQLPGKVKWTKKAYFKKLRYEASLKAKAKDA